METALGVSRGSSPSFAIRAWLDLSPLSCRSEEVFVELVEACGAGAGWLAEHLPRSPSLNYFSQFDNGGNDLSHKGPV